MNRKKLFKTVASLKQRIPLAEEIGEVLKIFLVTVLITFIMLVICHWLLSGKFGILYYQF